MPRLIERLLIVAAALALAIAIIALLSGGLLAGRDEPGISGAGNGPGVRYRDQGTGRLAPDAPHPAYDSNPPTSGPHAPAKIRTDAGRLSDDQLLQALEVGDVVLMYATGKPPPGLRALAAATAPRFTPALAATGQAVVLAGRAGINGIVALAWAHLLRVRSATDPALRAFVDFWLGRGAPRSAAGPEGSDQRPAPSSGIGLTAIVTRVSTHSRPASSVSSTSHTQVVRPRWRTRATPLIVPWVIGRRKLHWLASPVAVWPASVTVNAVPLLARLSAIAA